MKAATSKQPKIRKTRLTAENKNAFASGLNYIENLKETGLEAFYKNISTVEEKFRPYRRIIE